MNRTMAPSSHPLGASSGTVVVLGATLASAGGGRDTLTHSPEARLDSYRLVAEATRPGGGCASAAGTAPVDAAV
jgi:hypothetical protein